MEMFQYVFMQKAFLVGTLLAIIIPAVGVIVVLKRLSMIGDALSHTALAGVAIGLVAGINPVLSSMLVCIIATFTIEYIRKKFTKYEEISIAIVMSTGIGIAGLLSGFVKNSMTFNSFLFGSIVAISDMELIIVVIVSILVISCFILFYKELFYIAFDEFGAKLSGVPTKYVNTLFTFLTAVTVSIATRTVGALIVSSFMVIPVACSMQRAKSYKNTVIYSILFGIFFNTVGLSLSFYYGLKPGSTIVLTGIIVFIILIITKNKKRV